MTVLNKRTVIAAATAVVFALGSQSAQAGWLQTGQDAVQCAQGGGFGAIQPCYNTANRLYQQGLEQQGRGNEYHPIGSPQFFGQVFPNRPTQQNVQRMTYGVFGNNSNWPW